MAGAPDSGRLIDVPIESLPFVDELSVDVAAGPDAVWDALIAVTGEFTSRPGGSRAARALGCAHTERTADQTRMTREAETIDADAEATAAGEPQSADVVY